MEMGRTSVDVGVQSPMTGAVVHGSRSQHRHFRDRVILRQITLAAVVKLPSSTNCFSFQPE